MSTTPSEAGCSRRSARGTPSPRPWWGATCCEGPRLWDLQVSSGSHPSPRRPGRRAESGASESPPSLSLPARRSRLRADSTPPPPSPPPPRAVPRAASKGGATRLAAMRCTVVSRAAPGTVRRRARRRRAWRGCSGGARMSAAWSTGWAGSTCTALLRRRWRSCKARWIRGRTTAYASRRALVRLRARGRVRARG